MSLVRLCAVCLCFGLFWGQVAAQEPEVPFRVGLGAVSEGCHAADSSSLSDALTRYAAHLEGRLGVPVQLCGVTPEDAAEALSAGRVDFALASAPDAETQLNAIRPILRARPDDRLARTEFVLVGTAAAAPSGDVPPDAGAATLIAMNTSEADALAVIASVGAPLDPASIALSELFDPAMETALERGGPDKLMGMNVGRFVTYCQENASNCEDTEVVWRGFAPLEAAWSVPAEIDKERMYRLIGIHAMLHLEQPAIFKTVAGETALEFEPTEPWAFTFRNTVN